MPLSRVERYRELLRGVSDDWLDRRRQRLFERAFDLTVAGVLLDAIDDEMNRRYRGGEHTGPWDKRLRRDASEPG